jgi:hypothetical protein
MEFEDTLGVIGAGAEAEGTIVAEVNAEIGQR